MSVSSVRFKFAVVSFEFRIVRLGSEALGESAGRRRGAELGESGWPSSFTLSFKKLSKNPSRQSLVREKMLLHIFWVLLGYF